MNLMLCINKAYDDDDNDSLAPPSSLVVHNIIQCILLDILVCRVAIDIFSELLQCFVESVGPVKM